MKTCKHCNGEGTIEILGDGDNFEMDVIGHKTCRHCDRLGEVEEDHEADRPLNYERD